MLRSALILTLFVAACAGEDPAPLTLDFPEATKIPLAGRGEKERDFLLAQDPGGYGFVFTRMSSQDEMRLLRVTDPMNGETPVEVYPGALGDADAVFDPAGGRLLLMAKGRHGDPQRDDFDLFEADWRRGRAGEPKRLEALNTEFSEVFPAIARDGTMVFASPRPGSLGGQDLYEAMPVGDGFEVRKLDEINSTASDNNPMLFPDGDTLIFFSGRRGGLGGPDLYVSRRQGDGTWGEPVNLGPEVNTGQPDYAPSLSADGKVLFFARGPEIYGINIASIPALAQ